MSEDKDTLNFKSVEVQETWVCRRNEMFNGRRLAQLTPFGNLVVFEVEGYSPGDSSVKAFSVGGLGSDGNIHPSDKTDNRLIVRLSLREDGWVDSHSMTHEKGVVLVTTAP